MSILNLQNLHYYLQSKFVVLNHIKVDLLINSNRINK